MILFLDIDGVLHEISRSRGVLVFLPDFERIMRDFPDVDIVISSAWRQVHSLPELRTFFNQDIAARIIDFTPIIGGPIDYDYSRETEILTWIRENGREYERWVALDDCAEYFSYRCPNLIVVDGDRGLNPAVEAELRKRLS